ncbi:glutamate racemase [Marinobacterium rhizophilum]|uniref:Glutamate racemase n=1 Tax=Marinobacterium rhizophilum TaxID=420402 RepID=A0ABY5HLI4_9GAMM|nr:glutamate racemase [Marinobacterium rhizophilum]UTW11796.1 glutamate racemase [Marinobacterium rhizophilum]
MSESQERRRLSIGVFDSGVGGLTVLNELRRQLPSENLIYLGDTARVPYGTKSSLSVTRYAEQAARLLVERKVKLLVIACNTVSAVAVEPLRLRFPDVPVVGVVEPGAEACCAQTRNGQIGVIATESTVNNQAYQKAIMALRPDVRIRAQGCSLFVSLAEEGWHEGDLVEQIVARCLSPLLDEAEGDSGIDTLVLGCTHFPALKGAIAKVVGPNVSLVDSAVTTTRVVRQQLLDGNLMREASTPGHVSFLVTDGPERFVRVASYFFEGPVDAAQVELVDLQHYAVA